VGCLRRRSSSGADQAKGVPACFVSDRAAAKQRRLRAKGGVSAFAPTVGRAGTRTGHALSWGRSLPSPAWTLVTPYCKRIRPGRGTNTKAAGFPPLSRPSPATSLPPFALAHALDPSGLGHAATFTRRLRDPPVSKRRQSSIVFLGVNRC
jgi:hypothetical protein